jgi:hypothetical protein
VTYGLCFLSAITRIKAEYGQNINKALQDTCFQKICIAQSPITPDTDAQHMNAP